jgi:hypothetical protein
MAALEVGDGRVLEGRLSLLGCRRAERLEKNFSAMAAEIEAGGFYFAIN